ncbi:UDP-glucose dehydrogenase family protein [Halarcobacter anaerophilus]|uniref:UDP-glucose 6-dehydrogenase n=1 Tax=Halarcobacter anaerophilus TaxID=877500 RepID=A0A4V1LPS4_9BACT|nr:nucleotide sugar dehydrogenase [Halarcobacter anaerophilus]QDF30233.1 UDP-glucose 6-dehydrogenase [Halarcobacter anaerophilus]RXJ62208.1 UDP-glucose 6-dehydrogenase [Halarcobacter anaerophilus]
MIGVIGLGFVGLTTALGFSEKGYKVYGYDIDRGKTDHLKKKKVPFHEPGLPEVLDKNLDKNFFIEESLLEVVSKSEIIFYCVGTPTKESGGADLTYLYNAIDETLSSQIFSEYKVLVIKSTVPPSTTEEIISPYIESKGYKVGSNLGLANNPEFLREGFAWDDFMNPDRIVIGVNDKKSSQTLEKYYKPFNADIHIVSFNTGEFIKYLSNTLLSTLISYSNEMSMIAKTIGNIDISKSFSILHEDKRWLGQPAKMSSYVYPGCGFGGYCLPKDTEALYKESKNKGFEALGLKNVLNINEKIKSFLVNTVEKEVPVNKTIGILGLSFKPNSDDVRDTPAKYIIQLLLEKGYSNIIAYDPLSNKQFQKVYKYSILYVDTLEELISKTDCNILLTAWEEFKIKKELIFEKKLFDFRYFLEKS